MAAEAVVSGVLRAVSYQASSLSLKEARLVLDAQEEIEKLKTTVSQLQPFLSDAERRRQGENSVKIWLQNLQDVACDAEDILDELNTEALRLRVKKEAQTAWISLIGDFLLSCFTCSAQIPIFFRYQIARRVKVVRERLSFVLDEGKKLGFHESIAGKTQSAESVQSGESSSLVLDSEVVGRASEKYALMKSLLPADYGDDDPAPEANQLNFALISIIGMGGLGKTTLAQTVYNDEMVRKHFKPRIWVSVSGNSNPRKLISDIIESVTKDRPNLTTLDNLQNSLVKLLQGKRFLLVLDDVWNEQTVWNSLRIPLNSGKTGSKVVLTSRNQINDLPTDMGMISINLIALSFDDCWSIFQRYVFVEGSQLEMVGRKIVKLARGVPLVAKALGSLAKSYGYNQHRWWSILKDDLPQFLDDEMDILSTLMKSYNNLSASLKQCFAFCAIFPKGHVFDKSALVNMWMALGFVQAQAGQRMEDVGSDYFDELLRRTFFNLQRGEYIMHDFMRSLAELVSRDECLRITGGVLEVKQPCRVRHVSINAISSATLKDLQKFSCLRSLVFLKQDESLSVHELSNLFKKLKSLRVLDASRITKFPDSDSFLGFLWSCFDWENHNQFPNSIGFLKLLRYLHLSVNDVRMLPRSVGTLYNLQNLYLKNCKKNFRLPREMKNLVNLRHFFVDAFEDDYQIAHVGGLTALQELKRFSVGRCAGSKIEELKNLNDLCGRLSISNLENVLSGEEARKARLHDKHYIDSLELEWSRGAMDNRAHEEVLNCLKPHIGLKELVIRNYAGIRSSSWLQDLSLLFLESVHFINCRWWKVLPPLGELQFLKELELEGVDGGGDTGCFEFFDDDHFEGTLIEWNGWKGRVWFPQLLTLRIRSSFQLHRFPTLTPTLRHMSINTPTFTAEMIHKGSHLSPGKILRICQFGDQNLNWLSLLQHHLWALKDLNISNCGKLASLSRERFSIPSLRNLSVNNCPVLYQLPPLPPILQELKLHNVALSDLPGSLPSTSSSLSCLEISECSMLTSITGFLLNQELRVLKKLIIYDCHDLYSLPSDGFQSLSSLEHLDISGNFGLKELPPLPPRLKYLGLDRLGLRALPEFSDCRTCSPCLRKLEISECHKLASVCQGLLQQNLRELKELFICLCGNLEYLPFLKTFSSLEVLTVAWCPKLLFLKEEELPSSLVKLEILDCHQLMEQYKRTGYIRPKVFFPQLSRIGNRWRKEVRAKRGFREESGNIYDSDLKRRKNQHRRRARIMELVIRDIFACCL